MKAKQREKESKKHHIFRENDFEKEIGLVQFFCSFDKQNATELLMHRRENFQALDIEK